MYIKYPLLILTFFIIYYFVFFKKDTIVDDNFLLEKIKLSDHLVENKILEKHDDSKIPKKIIQSFSSKLITEGIRKNIDNWIDMNPKYSYLYFDESDIVNYIKKYYTKRHLKAFYSIEAGAGRADFFRYLYLFNEGGFWIDITIVCMKPLDQIVSNDTDLFLVYDVEPKNIYNAIMGFPKNHPIMKECIEKCIENIEKKTFKGLKNNCIYHTTGPELIGKIYKKYMKKNKNVNLKLLTKELDKRISKYNFFSRSCTYEKLYIYDKKEAVMKTKFLNSKRNLEFVSNKKHYEKINFFFENDRFIQDIITLNYNERTNIINPESELILVLLFENYNFNHKILQNIIEYSDKFYRIIFIDNFSKSSELTKMYLNFFNKGIEIYINPLSEKNPVLFMMNKIGKEKKKIFYLKDLNLINKNILEDYQDNLIPNDKDKIIKQLF